MFGVAVRRNGWAAAVAALRGWVEDAVRRRGRGVPLALSELPVSLPLSRFQWPIGQGKGVRYTLATLVCIRT